MNPSGRHLLHVEPVRLPSLRAVALVVQRAAVAIGLDVAMFAGRSLRAGFATSAKRIGPTSGASAPSATSARA